MIKERNLIGLGAAFAIAVLAACGGGGGGSLTTPSTGQSQSVPAGYARAQFSISVPSGSGSSSIARRSPKYVAPGTQSITLTLLQTNGTPVNSTPLGPFNLVAGSTGCSAVNVTPLTCTFSINAPIGTDVYIANTFSSPNGVGPLGSGAVALSVVQNATNTASLVLSGPISTVLAFTNNSYNNDTLWNGVGEFDPYAYYYSSDSAARRPAINQPSASPSTGPTAIPSERLYFVASDNAGNIILNPTTYDQPITVTLFLNGGPANVALTDVPPSGLGTPEPVVSTDGGSVQVLSPADVVTLSLIPTVNSPLIYSCCGYYYIYANFPSVAASLASPPANFSAPALYFQAEVVPTPSPTPVQTPTPSPSPTGYIQVIGS